MLSETHLQQLMSQHKVTPFRFGGCVWLLDGRYAVYCPELDCLLIADLHFEKGSYLSQYAAPVPRYDSRASLRTIDELITTYQPKVVLCLGDSFHDIGAFGRLIDEDFAKLQQTVSRPARWVWLTGNHDPEIPPQLAGERKNQEALKLQSGEIVYCHHIPDKSARLQIVGHFHPKATLKTRTRQFRGKSLVVTESLMVLPALGQYTGGLNINDEVMLALAPPSQRQCYIICEQRVIALPAGS